MRTEDAYFAWPLVRLRVTCSVYAKVISVIAAATTPAQRAGSSNWTNIPA